MTLQERLIGLCVGAAEALARPGAARKASQTRNFFLPQFQLALGTVVHATPVVEVLKREVPGARIVVAATGLPAQVWAGNPHLERLLDLPDPAKHLRGAIRALRSARIFDGEPYTSLFTIGNERTNVLLATMLGGPSRRVGYAVHPGLLHTPVPYDPDLSQIQNNLRLLAAAGITASCMSEPRLYPPSAGASTLLPPREPGSLRIALATQTSITQLKKWREERWVELALALRERYSAELIFIGAESEAAAINQLREKIPFPTQSLAGQTTILQLGAVLQQCDLGVMLDTGPLHVGRAVQLPIVIIAPAWSPEIEWLPVGNPRYRILKKRDFAPPVPSDYIIDEVTVPDVLGAVAELVSVADLSPARESAAVERTPGN